MNDIEHLLAGGVSTDTRTLKPGNVFIALVGPNFDGHNFLEEAYKKGAVAAVVDRAIETPLPLIQVEDTRLALGEMAKRWRQCFSIPIIALTGSCGKTTTKAMLASILSLCGETLVTPGTLNNDIGVPLTLLQLNEQHEFAVIEMGTNHLGEIGYLTHLTHPTIAMVLNAGPGHLEFLGTVEGVAREKGAIYEGLSPSGVAIINADDHYATSWDEIARSYRRITFAMNQPADVWATDITFNTDGQASFILHIECEQIPIQLSIAGQHNVMNALAAAAAVQTLDIPLATIKAGLEAAKPVSKRLVQSIGLGGARIIDDTYNANPASFEAAIGILTQLPGKEKILIMGDMRELGPQAADYHRALGAKARSQGIHHLYAVGPLSHIAVQAFGQGAQHFSDQSALIEAVRPLLHADLTVLVKGSRGMQMEHVVAALLSGDQ